MTIRRLSWGTGIALAYAAFAAGTIAMVTFAIAHPVDLVGANYYEDATAYDARIAAIERTDAVGGVVVTCDTKQRLLRIALPTAHARLATGTVTMYRPSAAQADRSWPLNLDSEARMTAVLTDLPAGFWRVRVEWTVADQAFYRELMQHLP